MIAWLSKRLASRDPGQLGLFETVSPTGERPLRTAAEVQVATPTIAEISADENDDAPADAVVAPTHDAKQFLHALRARGLRGVDRIVLTKNRRTMVSLAGGVLRVHEGFVAAPEQVHEAIAVFATSRNRARRAAARDIIVAFPVPIRPPSRRPAAQHPDDAPMAARLTMLHAQLNLEQFDGALAALDVQVSRRLARRLGHYTPRTHNGGLGEIVISRRHVRRDGWPEAIHTLLHEMVHQWQDETGRPVDHGSGFREKCRAVGIEAAATRMLPR